MHQHHGRDARDTGDVMKVKSGQLKSSYEIRFQEIELSDTPVPGHVLVRIEACGICGTDLTAATTAKEFHPVGHEVAGVVEKVASDVKNVQVGQKVVLESSSFCGTCELCRNGRVDLCNKAPNFWGQPAMGFSTHMMAPACCCVPYDGLSPEVASLAEPAGVAYDMVETAKIKLGERVAVVGPGPIGLMAAAFALRGGASSVAVIGREHSKARLEVARKSGAEIYATNAPLTGQKDLEKRFEHVLVTAPVGSLVDAFSLAAYGGEITYIGIGVGSGNITFDANDFHFRKLQLRASFASPAIYYPHVLRLLKAGVVPAEIISHRFELSKLSDAFNACRDDKAGVVKVVVTA